MTRETKIGLLVGLAFIIVIGILLSDHMTATTEPIAAPLANTAGNVRESVEAPVTDPPPITMIVRGTVTPRDPVMTHNESPAPRTGQAVVNVGPAAGNAQPIQIRQSKPVEPAPAPVARNNQGASEIPPPNPTDPSPAPNSLEDIARNNGETLVDMNGKPADLGRPATPAPDSQAKKYTAEAGDTLSRIAGRFMGGNTKANRDAIVKANPSLHDDPNKIIVGRTYLIPSSASTSAAVPSNAKPAVTDTAAARNSAAINAQPQFWYTVKENDSLWSIAADQLGNGSAYTAIKELNADVLKGSDTVVANMRLRLPAKPVASAAQ